MPTLRIPDADYVLLVPIDPDGDGMTTARTDPRSGAVVLLPLLRGRRRDWMRTMHLEFVDAVREIAR